MAITHVVFHLPAGLIGIAFYHVLSTPDFLGKYVDPLWTLYLLSMSVSIFGSLADFFIYLYAFPAFRESVRRLIFQACLCRNSDSRHAMINQPGAMASTVQRSTVNEMPTRSNALPKMASSFDSTATL